MITPRHLQQILAIAELGTFNQAAQRLNLSQPALTASIGTLEGRLGVRLFLRSKKGAELTKFGQHVVETAPEILSRLNRLEDELGLLAGGERGSLRVAAGPVVIHGVLRQVVAEFCRAFPDFELTILTRSADQIAEDVAAGRLDLGIGALNPETCGPEVILRSLAEDRMEIASRPDHPLQSYDQPSLAETLGYPASLPEIPSDILIRSNRQNTQNNVPFRTTLTTDQYDVIMNVVQNSNMLTCAPMHLLKPYLDNGRLSIIHHDEPRPIWQATAAYRPVSALSPAFTAFMDMIQNWYTKNGCRHVDVQAD